MNNLIDEMLNQVQNFTPAIILTLGLAIGLQHAFEPDHVAAVTTQLSKVSSKSQSFKQIVKERTFKSSILGVFWGAGHTTSLVLMGLLVYVLAINIPKNFFFGIEFIVGIMLVYLAITTLWNKKLFRLKHVHPHTHKDGTVHIHPHEHDGEHKHAHKSYLIGCIHGLAGSGSLVVLTASTLGSIEMVLSFILILGLGSIIGMTLVSGLIGLPFAFTNKAVFVNKIFRYVVGSFCLLLGANIIYEIGVLNNVFGF